MPASPRIDLDTFVHDIADALEQLNPELLVAIEPSAKDLKDMAAVRDHFASSVPLIVARETAVGHRGGRGHGERRARHGGHRPRRALAAVIRRELRAFRMERTLTTTLRSAQDYRQKLETVLRRSNDAIAQVQEGIVVQVNNSWLELFGYADPSALVGQPVMDLFTPETQAALRAPSRPACWADGATICSRWRTARRRFDRAARAGARRQRI